MGYILFVLEIILVQKLSWSRKMCKKQSIEKQLKTFLFFPNEKTFLGGILFLNRATKLATLSCQKYLKHICPKIFCKLNPNIFETKNKNFYHNHRFRKNPKPVNCDDITMRKPYPELRLKFLTAATAAPQLRSSRS